MCDHSLMHMQVPGHGAEPTTSRTRARRCTGRLKAKRAEAERQATAEAQKIVSDLECPASPGARTWF